MIIASTAAAAAEPYTPSWVEGQTPPTFYLRAGDVIERELMEAQLASPAYGAAEIWPWERQRILLEGLSAMGGDDAPFLIALAETAAKASLDDAAEILLLDQATALVAQHFAPYRLLVEQADRRRGILPIVAFCRYCVRWDNLDADLKRGMDGMIDPASLSAVPPMLIRAAGVEAYNRQYGSAARKNSDAPLKSGADHRTSPLDASLEKDGSSRESATGKIPE